MVFTVYLHFLPHNALGDNERARARVKASWQTTNQSKCFISRAQRLRLSPMTNDPPADRSPGSLSCTNTTISSSSGSGGLKERDRCLVGIFRRFHLTLLSRQLFTKAQKEINRICMSVFLRSWHSGRIGLPPGS